MRNEILKQIKVDAYKTVNSRGQVTFLDVNTTLDDRYIPDDMVLPSRENYPEMEALYDIISDVLEKYCDKGVITSKDGFSSGNDQADYICGIKNGTTGQQVNGIIKALRTKLAAYPGVTITVETCEE